MAVEFKIRDFLRPVSILRTRRQFERNQWASSEELVEFQLKRLRSLLEHAFAHVPYYRSLFKRCHFHPADLKRIDDMKNIPTLTKEELRRSYADLTAENAAWFNPQPLYTSGTSGERTEFLVDAPGNAIEFCYYWRHWGWARYRLGDRFAQFSPSFFLQEGDNNLFKWQPLIRRLLLNTLAIDGKSVMQMCARMNDLKIRFLKGHPSTLQFFCQIVKDRNIAAPALRAVFAGAEVLYPHQRRSIESTFGCKVYDHYGQMERVVAATDCPFGRMHVVSDYGLMEFEERQPLGENRYRAKIIGTNLYNRGMPLIRYDTGDWVEYVEGETCECGRGFPVISRIQGRTEDTVTTPDGKIATVLYTIFSRFNEIQAGQIIQEKKDLLRVKVAKNPSYSKATEEKLAQYIRRYTGESMKIDFEFCDLQELLVSAQGGKFKVIASKLGSAQ